MYSISLQDMPVSDRGIIRDNTNMKVIQRNLAPIPEPCYTKNNKTCCIHYKGHMISSSQCLTAMGFHDWKGVYAVAPSPLIWGELQKRHYHFFSNFLSWSWSCSVLPEYTMLPTTQHPQLTSTDLKYKIKERCNMGSLHPSPLPTLKKINIQMRFALRTVSCCASHSGLDFRVRHGWSTLWLTFTLFRCLLWLSSSLGDDGAN